MKTKLIILMLYLVILSGGVLVLLSPQPHYAIEKTVYSIESRAERLLLEEEINITSAPIRSIYPLQQINETYNTNFLFVTPYHLINYDLTSNTVLWNITVQNQTISDVIPLNVSKNKIIDLAVAFSNGTLIKINYRGIIVWSISVDYQNSCSDFNCSIELSIQKLGDKTNNGGYIVAGSNNDFLSYFDFDGGLIKKFNLNTSIVFLTSVINTTVAASQSGDIFLLNQTPEIVWQKSLNITGPIIDLNIYQNKILTGIFPDIINVYSLLNGEEIKDFFPQKNAVLTSHTIIIPDYMSNSFYLAFLDGLIQKYDLSGRTLWETKLDTNIIVSHTFADLTSAKTGELILGSDDGKIFVVNQTTGEVIDQQQVSQTFLYSLIPFDQNTDGIEDILVGTNDGLVKVYYGKDRVPPKIISKISYSVNENNTLSLNFTTTELTTADLILTKSTGLRTIFPNKTYSIFHEFIIPNLDPESFYFGQIIIKDKADNEAKSEEFLIETNPLPPTVPGIPWEQYFTGLVLVLGITVTSYLGLSFLMRKRYYSLAERALALNDYAKAIKFFYKAKAQDRIVNIVKTILQNPELASKMNEIAKTAELQDYIQEIYDLIAQEG